MAGTDKEDLQTLFEMVSRYFSVLSEPTRLNILHTLCDGERSVGDIVEATQSTQTNISRHLKLMYDAHILSRRKEGTLVFYRVANEYTIDLCKNVCTQMAIGMEPEKKMSVTTAKKFARKS